ncbi:M91 family zinc metallopeptidase [Pedobacter helvus]|uniref:M91 family zinc metallopeptidase n=1 Tax=Pedobacter helvus TaxID=2563444 RepID=A0ABW9JDA0_9SPHI|nr:M91 family zinc metallopeptidase [Pedobacter ureilyticus]
MHSASISVAVLVFDYHDATDYVDGIQYTNGNIDFIQTGEGMAQNSDGSTHYTYRYNLSDLPMAIGIGNVRTVFDIYGGVVRILQRDDYYAFGLRKSGLNGNGAVSLDNKYLYNGKELQDELEQYDYGARFYDPVIGRFNVIDRFAEKYYNLNPYQYGANNPVLNIDVNGDSVKVNTNVSADLSGIGLGKINIPTTVYFQGGTAYYQNGTAYNGTDSFVGQVGAALTELNKGAIGQALVSTLESSTNTTTILNDVGKRGNLAANDGSQVRWDPNGNVGGPQQGTSSLTRPSFLGLGHELAHVNDVWNGTIDRGNWFQSGTDPSGNPKYVQNAEKYATRVENWLRAEHKLPLRTHYSPDASGYPYEPSRIIAPKTNMSLFYFQLNPSKR